VRLAHVTELSWIDRYVPDELRRALGDLVIVAADVEWSVYGMARIYRVPEPQRESAKRVIGKLEARIGNLGIPPWSDAERSRLIAWCHAARILLQERDTMIHASMSLAGERPDGKLKTRRWSLRDNQPIESEAPHVERLVRLLIRVRHAGIILEHGLSYPSPGGRGRIPPEYVTFGRTVVPPMDVPKSWLAWAALASPSSTKSP
jgi:hypothetical protein